MKAKKLALLCVAVLAAAPIAANAQRECPLLLVRSIHKRINKLRPTPRRGVADAVGTRTDRLSYPLDLDGTLMRRLVFGVLVSSLAACGVTSPIVPAINSKSAFAGAKGTTTTFKQPYPDYKVYRVFIQGESMSAVIKDALEQASDFCGSNGERMDTLQETVANPPYGRGNPPRIEYVFQCVRGPMKSQLY